MRGDDSQQAAMFSYLSPEERVPKDHPLRTMRALVDGGLKELSRQFDTRYSHTGRPSIAPEKLLRALLLQVFSTIRSERLLMEQLDYNLLFRQFVGLNMDDVVWDPTVFSKNRERLLAGEVAQAFFDQVLAQARKRELLSDDHNLVAVARPYAIQYTFRREGRYWSRRLLTAVAVGDVGAIDWDQLWSLAKLTVTLLRGGLR